MSDSLIGQIKKATGVQQVEELRVKGESYKYAPPAWHRKMQRLANEKVGEIRSEKAAKKE